MVKKMYNKPENCLHLHFLCMNCDMQNGTCHCFDGGEWYCQDCNHCAFEFPKVCFVYEDEAKKVKQQSLYKYEEHERRYVANS